MGTNYIAPTWRQPENANKDRLSNYSVNYSGSNQYITVNDNIFSGLETWSMAGFYNLSTLTSDSAIFGKYGNSPQQILLYWDAPLGWRLLWNGVSTTGQIVQLPTIETNEWHFIAVTYDGTTVKMYLDDQVYTGTASTGALITDTDSWQIGADGNAVKDFRGKLSQLSFYDYAVGATEIAYLRNGGNPLIINGAEPISYYPLGDNSNPTATAGYPNIISAADSVFDFDGSTDYIDTPQIDLGVNSSITMWFKPATTSYALLGEASSGFDYLVSRQSGSFYVWMGSSVSNLMNFGAAITSNIITDEWNFLAIVKTGDSVTVYLNNSDGEFSATETNANVAALSLKFDRIGARTLATPTLYYDGEMSNILGFETSLSSTEVSTIYNNGLPLLELSEIPQKDNLMVWYKLNQSAVLTPGTPTNWTITKIGSPNYSGSNDGCYAGTSGTSPYNSGLVWHDNNSGATVGSDYFQWNSPTIYTSGSNIVLSSSGGSYLDPYYGSQAILEYNIDNGSWVSWHTQTNGPGGFSANSFSIPSTGNLTVSNNIQIRIKGVDRGSSGSFLRINDVNATGGTSSYNESFTNATRYGFSGGSETQPPATFSADHWEIPDNRSAFPQSFSFDGVDDQIDLGLESGLSLGGASKYSTSLWFKKGSNSTNCLWGYNYGDSNGSGLYLWQTSGNLRLAVGNDSLAGLGGYGYYTIVSANIPIGEWTNIVVVFDGTLASGNDRIKVYQNGEVAIGTYTNGSNFPATLPTGNGASDRNVYLGQLQLGGGSFSYSFDGEMSNVMQWDTDLSLANANTIYNNGVPLPTASVEPSSLKVWYNLDKPTSTWNGTNWLISDSTINPTYTEGLFFGGDYIGGSPLVGYAGMRLTNQAISSDHITHSFWYKRVLPTTGGSDDMVVPGPGIYLGTVNVLSGGGVQWVGDGASKYINFSGSIADGAWHHVLVYYPNGATINHADVKCYIDGSIQTNTYIGASSSSGPVTEIRGTLIQSVPINVELSNWSYFLTDQTSNIDTIYNGGTPGDISSLNPSVWLKYDSATTAFAGATGANYGLATDSSGNSNNGNLAGKTDGTTTRLVTSNVQSGTGVSSGMTENNLIDDNVSTVNGESDTLPGTALVQSDLTRKLPFSNYSVELDGLDYFKYTGTDFEFGDGTTDTSFSISTWVNLDSIGSTWVSCGSTTQRRYRLGTRGTGVLTFELYSNNTSSNSLVFDSTSATLLTLGTWYNVIASYDAANTTLKLFVDGQEVVGTLTNNSYTAMGTGSTEMNFGRFFSNGTTYLEASISNFCFYKQTISDEEALDIYNNGIPSNLNSSFTPGTPYAWFPMDQNYTYFNGLVLIARDNVGGLDLEGVNVIQSDIIGNAPGSEANGIGTNLTIADLKGDMKNSINNSYSINMADYADGVTNPADSGRSTNVP